LLYDAAGAGDARPAGFPARVCLFYSAGPHMCGPYCMAPQGPAQVLGLTLPAAGAMHPGRDEYHPYKIISPRHNTVQRQVSGAMFIYNCIVNETAAFEWFWGDFLQLYLKYKKMHSGIVAQNLQLYRKY
jgi:hypothetical protein